MARQLRPSNGRAAAINHLLIVGPVLLTVLMFIQFTSINQIAFDFHHDFWVAGFRVRTGLSPYGWSRAQIAHGFSFPYPAPAALLFVPFSLLPRDISDLTFVVLSLAACMLTLRILKVSDWRPYTLVLAWLPVVNAWQTANLTLVLTCGVALTWRYRDSPKVAGVLTGLMLSVKPIVWPLLLWLVITRRIRATGYALISAVVVNAIAWMTLGFGAASDWWHLLAKQTAVVYNTGYGLTALAAHMGAGRAAGTVVLITVTMLLALACYRVGRGGDERGAFMIAVALMLASSPQVDNHYFALLIVPLALARPYLSLAWLAPLLLWMCPATRAGGWQVALAWGILGAITLWLVRNADAPRSMMTKPSPAAALNEVLLNACGEAPTLAQTSNPQGRRPTTVHRVDRGLSR